MNRAKGAKHVRTEGEYRKITQLRNSRGRDLISLFSRKVMRSWDRVRASTARCAKDDRCGDEKTAGGGAVCRRLKVRGAGWDMRPRQAVK